MDKNHNVYTDTQVGDGMFRYTPSTNQWTYFQLPTHGCSSRHTSFDDNKNEAWVNWATRLTRSTAFSSAPYGRLKR